MREADEPISSDSKSSLDGQRDLPLDSKEAIFRAKLFHEFSDNVVTGVGLHFGIGLFLFLIFMVAIGVWADEVVCSFSDIFGLVSLVVFTCGCVSVLTGGVACLVLKIIHHVVYRFSMKLERVATGAMAGGIVGFIFAWLLGAPLNGVTLIHVGILLAMTLVGQVGGARGAWKSGLKSKQFNLHKAKQKPLVQFSLRQLLIVTACCAVLLTLIKITGTAVSQFLTLMGIWFFIQYLGLLVIRGVGRIRDRKAVASRST